MCLITLATCRRNRFQPRMRTLGSCLGAGLREDLAPVFVYRRFVPLVSLCLYVGMTMCVSHVWLGTRRQEGGSAGIERIGGGGGARHMVTLASGTVHRVCVGTYSVVLPCLGKVLVVSDVGLRPVRVGDMVRTSGLRDSGIFCSQPNDTSEGDRTETRAFRAER
jgi:hypothetical protein